MEVVYNAHRFDCPTCDNRQCENPDGAAWATIEWDISPAAEWDGAICPKPSVVEDTAVGYWYELYLAWRDRNLPPNTGGYADQSAKLMAVMGIISAWQSDHDAEVRRKREAKARHAQLANKG